MWPENKVLVCFMDPDAKSLAWILKSFFKYYLIVYLAWGSDFFFKFHEKMQARALKMDRFGNRKGTINFILLLNIVKTTNLVKIRL